MTPTSQPVMEYQPTSSQLDRATALRRFNWFYIYLPVIAAALLGLALVVLLLWRSLIDEPSRVVISGAADLILILLIIPILTLCSLVPISTVALTIVARQRGYAPLRRLQTILRQVDARVSQVEQKTKEITPRLVEPVIRARGRAAYIRTLLNKIKRNFLRS